MSVNEKLLFIREYYNNISDEEFRVRLEKSGFEINEDAPGQIVFEEDQIYFVVSGKTKNKRVHADVVYQDYNLGEAS